jgi:hypothetical protein
LHRALRCKLLGGSSRGQLPRHLPVLWRRAEPNKLTAATIELKHVLYTQNPQAKLEQLKLSNSYLSTWP